MQSGPVSDKKISMRTSRTVILAVVGLILLVAAYFASQYFLKTTSSKQAAAATEASTRAAQEMVDLLSPVVLQLQQQMVALAKQPDVVKAFQNKDADSLTSLAEQKQNAFASALRLRFYLPGAYEIDYESVPKIGFASIELLKQVEKSKLPNKLESHNPGTEDEHLVMIQPVLQDQQVIGLMHLSLTPEIYQAVMKDFAITDGFLALEQSVIGGKVDLATLGNTSFKQGPATAKVKVEGTQWRFAHWSALAQQSALNNPLLLYGLAALLGILAGVWWFFSRQGDDDAPAFIEDEDDGVIYQGAVRSIMEGAHPGVEKLINNLPRIGQARSINPVPEPVAAAPAAANILTDDTFDITGGSEIPAPPPAPKSPPPEPQPEPVKMEIDPKIFRAYDIRGIVGHTFNADVVEAIGLAIGSEAKDRQQQAVAVGRDGRSHGPELAAALIKGIAASGMNVIDVGMVPTPVLYFAAKHLEIDSGVMLTGSHNPPDYNGMKIVLGGDTLSGDAITGLRQRIESGNLHSGLGEVKEVDVKQDYLQTITNDIPVALGNSFKLVVDAGNGVAGELGPQLYRAMGHEVIEQFCEVDGSFPNHHPDPSQPSNMQDLIERVQAEDADLGFAFDGDGDRLGIVDKVGNIIWPDRQMILLAQDVLSRNQGATIIYDVKCSRYLTEAIKDAGGEPLMWKTGHSLIKAKMKEVDSPLAGEMSGHIFFKERWYGFDDALYTGARMLEILVNNEMSPTEVFAFIPEDQSTPELRVRLDESEHAGYMEKLKANADFSGATIYDIDGLRADYPDGWGLVRPSNTSPYLVMRFEAEDETALNRIKETFRSQMLAVKADLELPF